MCTKTDADLLPSPHHIDLAALIFRVRGDLAYKQAELATFKASQKELLECALKSDGIDGIWDVLQLKADTLARLVREIDIISDQVAYFEGILAERRALAASGF